MIFLVERARKEKRNKKKNADKEDDAPVKAAPKRSAYLEFLAAMGDKSLAEKRVIWRDMSVKER